MNNNGISDAPLSQAEMEAKMRSMQNRPFRTGEQQQPMRQQQPKNDYFVLYYSENDANSRNFLGELHKTAFFKKFVILCVDKQGIKIPRCVQVLPTIIIPTKNGPRPLAGEMAMKWLSMAKEQSVPGNTGAGGGGAGGAGGSIETFDNKVAYGLKPFGDDDQLSSWDTAGSGGYSQGFALWSNNDTPTGLFDNNGAGLNSNYTPVGLQIDKVGGDGGAGGGAGGNLAHSSGGISGAGSLPNTGMETRVNSSVDQDFEQFMAMRDADPYVSKPPNRSGGGL